MKIEKKRMKLHTKISLLIFIIIIISTFITAISVSDEAKNMSEDSLKNKIMDIAHMTAKCPTVINGLTNKEPQKNIQEYTNKLIKVTNVQFIVVADMNGKRKSHPNPSLIGKKIVGGDYSEALHGKEYISYSKGTLGNSLRAFVPVYDDNGKQIGLVLVGILMNNVNTVVNRSINVTFRGIYLGLLAGIIGALLLSRNIKNVLWGMEPYEISKLLEQRSAMLESVREGIIAVDKNGYINLVNTESVKILNNAGIKENPIGKKVTEFIPNTHLHEVLKTGKMQLDKSQEINGTTLITNRVPIIIKGKIEGAIATFRDTTDLKIMSEKLSGIKLYANSLRAQTHEFMNKLHVILGLVQLKQYEKLSEYIKSIANNYQIEIGSLVRQIKDEVLAGFILGKLSYCRENNVKLTLSEDSYVPEPSDSKISHKLITIIGNLIDNAVDAVKSSEKKLIYLSLIYKKDILNIKITDSGCGISDSIKYKIFDEGFSGKSSGRGYGLFLVNLSIKRLNGNINVISHEGEGTTFEISIPYETKEI